jgi:hypothetical protein
MKEIEERLINILDAYSSGHECIHESVAPIVISLMKDAYKAGKKHKEQELHNQDSEYSSLLKVPTFNQWLKKKFNIPTKL